jgi:hypothetical protein
MGLRRGLGWTSESQRWRTGVAATFTNTIGGTDLGVVGGVSHTWN